MRVAVVGHVEWVEFLAVEAPPSPGCILHANTSYEDVAGGGGVAAAELARMAGDCVLYTAVGSDARGQAVRESMASLNVDVRGPTLEGPHRRGLTLTDPTGERTIIVVGESQAPASLTAADFADVDAVYFCKGDVASLRAARAARVLVVTARVLDVLREADVPVDALVCSAADPRERYTEGDLSWTPNLVARTEGAAGGRWSTPKGSGRWDAQPLPSEPRDAYGCGDSFAAGLTYALGAEMPMPEALAFAAGRGAGALCRSGAHGRF